MRTWAIRKVGTDLYLPQRQTRRGYSYDEPVKEGGKHGPRLFASRRAAEIARRAWLEGIWKPVIKREYETGYEEIVGLETVKMPDRKAEEMEIVCFNLMESAE